MSLRVQRDGPLLRIALARPEKRNSFDAALIAATAEAFASVDDERAVILSGDGSTFSAGGDLEWMRSAIDLTPEENFADALRLRAMFEVIDACPAPVVAAVQGHAIGAGCGVIACCDVVITHPDTVFAFGEVKLGIVPAVISPYVVARTGGAGLRRLFVTGERFDAETALRIGLVDEVASDLDAAVDRVVSELLSGGPIAVRSAKQIARAGLSAEASAQLIADLRTGAEGQEGLRAFLERRKPSWAE